jgi:hypothetical protein
MSNTILTVVPGHNIYMVAKQAVQLLQRLQTDQDIQDSNEDCTVSFIFNVTNIVVTWEDESSEDVIAKYYAARRTLESFQENWE